MSEQAETSKLNGEIDATRARLVANLEEIVDRAQPEKVVNRQIARVREFYLDEFGGVRMDRAAKTAGIFAGLVILRKLFK